MPEVVETIDDLLSEHEYQEIVDLLREGFDLETVASLTFRSSVTSASSPD
jgi:hypothetical protein